MLKLKHKIINFLNKKWPDPTPEEELKSDAEVVSDFINEGKNRTKAVLVAQGIKEDFPHWFTVKQLYKKYDTEPDAIVAQLQMLSLFQLCVSKPNTKNEASFKITLSKDDRIEVLEKKFRENTEENALIAKELKELQDS